MPLSTFVSEDPSELGGELERSWEAYAHRTRFMGQGVLSVVPGGKEAELGYDPSTRLLHGLPILSCVLYGQLGTIA